MKNIGEANRAERPQATPTRTLHLVPKNKCKMTTREILILIVLVISQGSDASVHPHSITCPFATCNKKTLEIKHNIQATGATTALQYAILDNLLK